jgi:hypothetical protein
MTAIKTLSCVPNALKHHDSFTGSRGVLFVILGTMNKHIHVPQRILSFGERVLQYRLEREAQIKQAKQDKRNRKVSKANQEMIDSQLSAPENDI